MVLDDSETTSLSAVFADCWSNSDSGLMESLIGGTDHLALEFFEVLDNSRIAPSWKSSMGAAERNFRVS